MNTEQLFLITAGRRVKEAQMLLGKTSSLHMNVKKAKCLCGNRIEWNGKGLEGQCSSNCGCFFKTQVKSPKRQYVLLAKPLKSLAGTDLHIGAVVRLVEPALDSEDWNYYDQCQALGTTFMVSGYNLAEDMLELSEIESDGRPYGTDSPQWTYMAPISAVEKVADFITIKNDD